MSNVENAPFTSKPSNNLEKKTQEEYQELKYLIMQPNFLESIEKEDMEYSLKNFFKCLFLAQETVKYKGVASVSLSLNYLGILGEVKENETASSHYIADLTGQIESINRMSLADIQKPWQAGSNVSYELRKVSNNNPHLQLLQKVVQSLFCPTPVDFSSPHNNAINLHIMKNKIDHSLKMFFKKNPFIEAQTNNYFFHKKINQSITSKDDETIKSNSFKL